jgi:hypothetical protein
MPVPGKLILRPKPPNIPVPGIARFGRFSWHKSLGRSCCHCQIRGLMNEPFSAIFEIKKSVTWIEGSPFASLEEVYQRHVLESFTVSTWLPFLSYPLSRILWKSPSQLPTSSFVDLPCQPCAEAAWQIPASLIIHTSAVPKAAGGRSLAVILHLSSKWQDHPYPTNKQRGSLRFSISRTQSVKTLAQARDKGIPEDPMRFKTIKPSSPSRLMSGQDSPHKACPPARAPAGSLRVKRQGQAIDKTRRRHWPWKSSQQPPANSNPRTEERLHTILWAMKWRR